MGSGWGFNVPSDDVAFTGVGALEVRCPFPPKDLVWRGTLAYVGLFAGLTEWHAKNAAMHAAMCRTVSERAGALGPALMEHSRPVASCESERQLSLLLMDSLSANMAGGGCSGTMGSTGTGLGASLNTTGSRALRELYRGTSTGLQKDDVLCSRAGLESADRLV